MRKSGNLPLNSTLKHQQLGQMIMSGSNSAANIRENKGIQEKKSNNVVIHNHNNNFVINLIMRTDINH